MIKILLNEPLTKWLLLKRRHSVYHGLSKPNQICRRSETSEQSMEEIHRHVHQFMHGTRNSWRERQCSIKKGVDDQEHPRKPSSIVLRTTNEAEENLNTYVSFCNNFHLSVSSFAFLINFRNCKETLWTLCTLSVSLCLLVVERRSLGVIVVEANRIRKTTLSRYVVTCYF